MKTLTRMTFLSVLFSAGAALAAPPELSALTCRGTYGPEGRTWTVQVTVLAGRPILEGRAFAELLRKPNFPSAIRIAPEGYYLLAHRLQGEFGGVTEYVDPSGARFDLRIPDAQPPGTHPTGPRGTLALSGGQAFPIACDRGLTAADAEADLE